MTLCKIALTATFLTLVSCDVHLPFKIPSGGSEGGSQAGGGIAVGNGGAPAAGGAPSTGGATLSTGLTWYTTCGDPSCHGYVAPAGVAKCSAQKVGNACQTVDEKCTFENDCNQLMVCAAKDPKVSLGGCPISRKKHKEDIAYLNDNDIKIYANEVLNMKLAHWRYTANPERRHLGFMIDDNEGSEAVDAKRDMVDLYGYTSMAVAALQAQKQEIEALKKQIELLQAEIGRTQSRRK